LNPSKVKVLSTYIDLLDWPSTLGRISKWAGMRESRYVCICNVHSVVTASRDAQYGQIVNAADMATPDGAPVAWMMRRLGFPRRRF
jgi:N-acetylglucosaminyldiphosphoundecaprenol N-acetyl-beta-D-mannosaminyltransferase